MAEVRRAAISLVVNGEDDGVIEHASVRRVKPARCSE
jgi:hypothetical protein